MFSPLTKSQKLLFEAIKKQDQNSYEFATEEEEDEHNSLVIKKKLNSFDFGI